MAGGRSTSLLRRPKHESPRSTARHARAHVRSRELGKAVQRLSDQWSGSGSTNLRLGSSQNISSQNGHVFTKGTFHELNLSAFMVLNDFNRSLVWFQSLFANNIKTTNQKTRPCRAPFVPGSFHPPGASGGRTSLYTAPRRLRRDGTGVVASGVQEDEAMRVHVGRAETNQTEAWGFGGLPKVPRSAVDIGTFNRTDSLTDSPEWDWTKLQMALHAWRIWLSSRQK